MSGFNQSNFLSSTDTIHAFTPFIFALNFINTILRKSWSLYRARKSGV